jgi:hypothetical protein
MRAVSDLTQLRRRNLLALFQEFAEAALAAGASAKGLEQAFAAHMEVSPSMWSQLKSSRAIGDRLARQFEHHGGKPPGWLDQEHAATAPDPAEERFIALARELWRGRSAKGRRELMKALKQLGSDSN